MLSLTQRPLVKAHPPCPLWHRRHPLWRHARPLHFPLVRRAVLSPSDARARTDLPKRSSSFPSSSPCSLARPLRPHPTPTPPPTQQMDAPHPPPVQPRPARPSPLRAVARGRRGLRLGRVGRRREALAPGHDRAAALCPRLAGEVQRLEGAGEGPGAACERARVWVVVRPDHVCVAGALSSSVCAWGRVLTRLGVLQMAPEALPAGYRRWITQASVRLLPLPLRLPSSSSASFSRPRPPAPLTPSLPPHSASRSPASPSTSPPHARGPLTPLSRAAPSRGAAARRPSTPRASRPTRRGPSSRATLGPRSRRARSCTLGWRAVCGMGSIGGIMCSGAWARSLSLSDGA